MARISRYGKVHGVRFRKDTEKWLEKFVRDNKLYKSEVIQEAVECIRQHPDCKAKKRLLGKLINEK